MSKDLELKPCPFCNDYPTFYTNKTFNFMKCSCGIQTSVFNTRDAAIKFWNKRSK